MAISPIEMPKTLQLSEKSPAIVRSLAAPSLFAAFPDALQQLLLTNSRKREFGAGQIIQQSGDAARGFWVIDEGQVKIGRYGQNGRFEMLVLMGRGDSYGELALFSQQQRIVDAVAVSDATLYWVDETRLNLAMAQDPHIARELIRILSAQLQESLNMQIVQRRLPAPKMLARSLLSLMPKDGKRRAVTVSQDDLAELVGTSRMTISTALGDMEEKGLIRRGYRRIEILDADALFEY